MDIEIGNTPVRAEHESSQVTVGINGSESPFANDPEHREALARTIGSGKMPVDGMLFLEGEWSKSAPDQANSHFRIFSLNGPALQQLMDLCVHVKWWVSSTEKVHRRVKKPRAKTEIVFEIRYIYGMTWLVAYELGRPNPTGDALRTLLRIRGDKYELVSIQDQSNNRYDDFDFDKEQFFISASGHRWTAPFISINLVDDKPRIELPCVDIWGEGGLDWLWNSNDCCEANRSNPAPWKGPVCDCDRQY